MDCSNVDFLVSQALFQYCFCRGRLFLERRFKLSTKQLRHTANSTVKIPRGESNSQHGKGLKNQNGAVGC